MIKKEFGTSLKGEKTSLYIFENKNGVKMEVTDFGATLYAVRVPKNGEEVDVVLGYDGPVEYEQGSGTFFGATVGRNANRIARGEITIDGVDYTLVKNNGNNNLHGGVDFYAFRLWDVKEVNENSIVFSLHSPHMDQGFPGNFDVDVTYTLTEENEIQISYQGAADAETIINMTNHSYFNLNGHASGNILDHELWMDADAFTMADAESIPTGEITPVENTPMDFRQKKTVGRDIELPYEALVLGKGYDHNWCLNNQEEFAKVAEIEGGKTGIKMEVYTDLPGMQIYTANYVDNEPGKDGAVYNERQGICFETQYYPDAVHHENFASPIYKAGEVYKTKTVYKFI